MSGQRQKSNSSGFGSFLFGAVAGAALAAGTYYLATKDEPCAQGQSRPNSATQPQPRQPRPAVSQSDKTDEKEEEQECLICLETFSTLKKLGVSFMALECGHVVCANCLADMRENATEEHVKCPVCRKSIRNQQIRRVYL